MGGEELQESESAWYRLDPKVNVPKVLQSFWWQKVPVVELSWEGKVNYDSSIQIQNSGRVKGGNLHIGRTDWFPQSIAFL